MRLFRPSAALFTHAFEVLLICFWTRAAGATADEFYKRYPSDIALMQSLGVRHFRLSIAWPRILPKGTGSVNQAGVNYYVGLVNALQSAGIQPYVTLCAPAT